MTAPCGRDTLLKPWCRVYGQERLPKLLSPFRIEGEYYWIKDEENRWFETSKEKALSYVPRYDRENPHGCSLCFGGLFTPEAPAPGIHPMITLFSTPKPFRGHIGVIQTNALKSWTLLHPDVDVVLFGDEDGAAEVARELRIRHEPNVERHESGMKYLHSIFHRAEQISRHDYLCYVNCDVVLMDDFWKSFELARKWRKRFLLTGHRRDTDVTQPLAFDAGDWAHELRMLALRNGVLQSDAFIDYFAFSKGLYVDMPPFVIGRSYWDQWLVWKALDCGFPVIDCTQLTLAVHQNHDYGYHPEGKQGTNEDGLAMRNLALGGGRRHQRHLGHCSRVILPSGRITGTWMRRMLASKAGHAVWKLAVHDTLLLRKRFGLRTEALRRLADKLRWKNRDEYR
jgi:hypothetical protein